MNTTATVSNEVISASIQRKLKPRLLDIVGRLQQDFLGTRRTADPKHLDELKNIIVQETGIKVTKVIIQEAWYENAAAAIYRFDGHHGAGFHGSTTTTKTIVFDKLVDKLYTTTIDLDKGFIKGPLTDVLTTELDLTDGLFTGECRLDTEEIAAIIAHEIGHMFNMFMTLGDYVWFNYYMTDGVEILLGKKPNKYKLQVMTLQGLENTVQDRSERLRLRKDPSEANIKRALLVAQRNMPRHHLHSRDPGASVKREEQLADLFASRQGFARAMVTGFEKMEAYGISRYRQTRASFIKAEMLKTLATVTFAPLTAFWGLWTLYGFVFGDEPEYTPGDTYDNITERLTKMKLDLVAQLKILGSDQNTRAVILADIEVVDNVLANYNQYRTVWEVLTQLALPERRRKYQLQKLEETLERLLNNDLFVASQRFNQLTNSRV